jgi:hypothetical protein
VARKSAHKAKVAKVRRAAENSWAVAGIDVSVTSMSGAMMVYDSLIDTMRGPGLFSVRWERDVHFLDRLAQAVRAADFIHSLIAACGPMSIPADNIWIGVEESWPAGIVRRAESGWLRQQAEVCGAFRGGLVRYGYTRVYDVNAQSWRVLVARDLDKKLNKDFTKWDVKKWAMFSYAVEERPDLYDHKTRGLIPLHDKTKAKPRQPDDCYDALGIMNWTFQTREDEVA